jgi:microcin C transport system substrate-binding protein
VREALSYAFDFEWTNRALFYDAYARTKSYFANSELASSGLPSEKELAILEPFRDQLPETVFTQEYQPPATDGSGNNRKNLRTASRLLKEAGWVIKDGQLVHSETGTPMKFEMMLRQPGLERIVLPMKKSLKRLGVDMSVRTVDVSQYQKRLDDFDFDMIVMIIPQSLSPGNEQRDFWSSEKANERGSRNFAAVNDAVVDALVEQVIAAPDRESLINRTRALDRVLLSGHYVIPNWHSRVSRVAYWDKFERPAVNPKYSLGFNTWWLDQDKATALEAKRKATQR